MHLISLLVNIFFILLGSSVQCNFDSPSCMMKRRARPWETRWSRDQHQAVKGMLHDATDELAKAAGEFGGIYMTHSRYTLGDRLLDPFREAVMVGRDAGVPVHIWRRNTVWQLYL